MEFHHPLSLIVIQGLHRSSGAVGTDMYLSWNSLITTVTNQASRWHHIPYEALYGRKCRTPVCWTELSEKKILGPDLVRDTEEKAEIIRRRLKEASDRQKSYADLKRRDIEYSVGDKVFLKVSPWKKILRFGQKGKLSPR
ncbi:uncharacterized protein LOC119370279 [Jatropha curcas]|uniref:uncharacterized protein LOC119370279 n=1 Tax=Jatropha curcas TaxID=180498 RepID=UPI0018949D1D|nr:uncharacterized protein LOC119370279 [Jatropha curcas]